MIWIATVFLLFVAAWLFFNGLNEKRWVDAHSHDETVASDKGLFAGLAARPMIASNDEKLSIDQENTRFARAVETVKRSSTRMGDYVERKVQQARISDDSQRPASAADEPNVFGRMVATVKQSTQSRDEKLMAKLQEQRPATVAGAGAKAAAKDDGMFDVLVRKVSGTIDNMESKVGKRVTTKSDKTVKDESAKSD